MNDYIKLATKHNRLLSKEEQNDLFLQFAKLRDILKERGLLNSKTPHYPLDGAVEQITREYPVIVKRAQQAIDKLIYHNIRQVIAISKFYLENALKRGLTQEDLVSFGIEGIMRSLYLFDPAKGAKFSAYAYLWIRQYMGDAVCRASAIYVPSKEKPNYFYTVQRESGLDEDFDSVYNQSPVEDNSKLDEVFSALSDKEANIVTDSITAICKSDRVWQLNMFDALNRGVSIERSQADLKRVSTKIREALSD